MKPPEIMETFQEEVEREEEEEEDEEWEEEWEDDFGGDKWKSNSLPIIDPDILMMIPSAQD